MSLGKKILKRVGLAAGVLLVILLIANAVLVRVTGRRLEARLVTARAAGEPVVLADLQRPPVEAEKNAATYLDRAREDIAGFAKETDAVQQKKEYGNWTLDEADRKALRAAFDAYPKMLPLLEQAAECPDFRPNLDFTAGPNTLLEQLLTETQRFRGAVSVLSARARLLLAEGNREAALQSGILTLRLARHFEEEPLIIGHLVLMALRAIGIDAAHRALRAGPVSDKGRAALDAELDRIEASNGYARALHSERAYASDSFRTQTCNVWCTRSYYNDDQCALLDVISRFVGMEHKPWSEVRTFEQEWSAGRTVRYMLTDMMVPALTKVHFAHCRVTAQARCLRVLNALQRRGKDDATLADLKLPAAVTTDPFNGGRLILKRTDGEWLIYAVGDNLTDDGGSVDRNADVGLGPVAK